ncbi:hypothetical protein DL98DRAFT_604071 [Cadophora sp. DSE1049]|nr:hypothetical protein DL98DRAFT_604071 [Cadophora sp. DSE1049]
MDYHLPINTHDTEFSSQNITHSSGPTKTEWKSRRPQITRLYRDEKLKLKEVMAIMEEDGFVATPRMYKDRITRWGLAKNIKKHEAAALLRLKSERDAMGKQTSIELHDRPLGMGRLLRHTKGKGLENTCHTVSSIPSYVRCKTPPPGAFITPFALSGDNILPTWDGHHPSDMIPISSGSLFSATPLLPDIMTWSGQSSEDAGSNSISHAVEEYSQMILGHVHGYSSREYSNISRPLSPPTGLKLQEELVHTIKAHFACTFQSGAWTSDGHGYTVNNISDIPLPACNVKFANYCLNAVGFKRRGLLVEFRRLLSKAFGLVPDILRAAHSRALEYLLSVFLLFMRHDLAEVTQLLRQYVAQMGANVIESHLPWQRLCRLLGIVETEIFEEAVIRAWKCNNDALRNGFGRFTHSSLMADVMYIRNVHGWKSRVEEEQLLRKLLGDFEERLGRSSSLTIRITPFLANNQLYQGKHMEAEDLVEVILAASRAKNSQVPVGVQLNALELLAHSQYRRASFLSAEKNIRRCIELVEQQWGMKHPWRLRWVVVLEEWLREWSRFEEANELRLKIDSIIGLDETDMEASQA